MGSEWVFRRGGASRVRNGKTDSDPIFRDPNSLNRAYGSGTDAAAERFYRATRSAKVRAPAATKSRSQAMQVSGVP